MATIAEQKAALEKWTPVIIFDVVLKDAVTRFWAKQAVTFGGNSYLAIVLEHSELKIEGNGIYGVDAVQQIGLTLNNTDANLNPLLAPANWQGGTIQPRFIFVAPNGTTTTDSIVYPKFLIDLPTSTWPRVEFSAHNKWNLARKMLPVSLVTRKDRYPFPDTDAERAAAGSDSGSEFFAIGYDPATGKGNWKTPPSTPWRRHEYDGTREKLKEMGLEVRFGGFGLVPPTVVGTPKKGEKADYIGNANEAKYGTAVPLLFGTCRMQPIVLDTGFPSGEGGWNGARLSHYLLSDGVTFPPDQGLMGIEDVLDVFIPDNKKYQRIPETSGDPSATGAWSFQGGYFGSQKAPASSKYRNIDQSIDFPDPLGDFTNRDLYSGLAYLEIGFPKELSGEDGIGPKLEAIVKGLKIETWDSGGNSTWQWTDNPIWIFVHLLKLLRWTTAEMDKTAIYNAAAYCDGIVPSGKKRFRCNLPLTAQTRAADILRGIRNNCRMYTSFAADGKLQLKIAQNVAGEGGLAFALDNTNIMRGDDGQLLVEKFHRSVFETANIFTVSFQNEDNKYNIDSFTRVDVQNVNQIDEKVPADSIFPIIGIPSFDQAERQIEWARQEQVTLNEYYRVTCSLALIEAKVGQVGTITEPRHALISQQVRIRAMAPGRDAGTVELTLQKHSDGAYTDQSVSTPFTRAQADSSYTPRSVGGKTAASPAPILTEITVADPINADTSVRRIKVEFKPPEQNYEGIFSRATKIRDVVVATSGGSVPGGQVLFAEVAPVKAGLRGLASEYLMVVVPSGGNSNSFSLTCELPPEADQYILFVGNFPGQTYEQTVASSPGTAPFTITVTNLARNFGSIPPDPAFDHVQIFYKYNSSPNVLRDGGRTFAPYETTIEFEPEAPAAEDTQVTVYVSSVNAAEDDFYPIEISPNALLTLTYENGPPMDWEAHILPGPTPTSCFAKFTRPKINGKRLFWVAVQFKDSSVGQWRESDENAGAAVTYYDGSGISHESIGGLKIKKDPTQPVGFGTAKADDLMMMDVAGGAWDKDRCGWGTIEKFLDDLGAETTAANARYIATTGGLFRPQTTQDLRMKIVKPHHTWDTEGYLGNPDGVRPNGVEWEWIGDREGDEFIIGPYEIGRDIASLDCRFWIENDYCRSGNNLTHSSEGIRVRSGRDLVLPGPLENLEVLGANGKFTAKWEDPLTGAATLDFVAEQWATDAAFTQNLVDPWILGYTRSLQGTDPNKTYYFRFAAHNQSGLPSHPSTVDLYPTGWGPWTVAPQNPVNSGNLPGTGAPVDSVIPGPLVTLTVEGADGNFRASWEDPATGNLTLDFAAEQWATDAGFTQNVETWILGYTRFLEGTDPGKTYYFRFAAHNQSGLPSDASTVGLHPTGWGPWTYPPVNPVSSGGPANAPIDTVIPGPLTNLSVTGGNGVFKAEWLPPATGNLTIDTYAEEYRIDAAFTQGGDLIHIGNVLTAQGTAPGLKYYFRFAAHNQSGLPSHASTLAALGATGWGPWTNASGNPVSSGLLPAPENIVFNGGFEIEDPGTGRLAGWIMDWDVGVPGCTYRFHGDRKEGTYSFVIQNNTTGKASIASKAFAVRSDEFLDYSVWAKRDGAPNNGFYFRVFYHASNPDFTAAEAATYHELYTQAPLSATWTQYQGRVKVAAGMGWARVALYNYGTIDVTTDDFFDDVQVLRVISGQEIDDNTIPAARLTGSARAEFIETFDEPLLVPPWSKLMGGTVSYPTDGVDGGKVLRIDGSVEMMSEQILIPFDPRKLYRLTARARVLQVGDAAKSNVYIGVRCYNNQKTYLANLYFTANNLNTSGWAINAWQELAGWVKGYGAATAGPYPDATAPGNCPANTSYITPEMLVNYASPEAPATNVLEIDDYRLESFEEEQYTTKAPTGTFSNLTYSVIYPWGDNLSSAISYYWTYTQGLVKADQFAIYLSDGTAYHVARVKALPGASGNYILGVYQMAYNRAFNASIDAEAIGASGVPIGATASWPSITPSATVGSTPAGSEIAGRVDWAGGNIWYDSEQYRNNQPPTNYPTATISATFTHHGSGGQYATITNIAYSQGAKIATHIAVLVKVGGGTINLNTDMVVSYMSMASLPSSYIVPLNLADNFGFTLGIAAVAECKNGRIFHTTYQSYSKAIDAIGFNCTNAPADGQGRRIIIGHTGGGDTIKTYGDGIHFYEGGGAKRAWVGGNSSASWLVNGDGSGFYVTPGLYPNYGFGQYLPQQFGYGSGGLGIKEIQYGATATPVGGGYLYCYLGAGWWYGSGGTNASFAASGPHCEKCGYDFWLFCGTNPKWGAYLAICGWCGAKYKKGPKTVLHLLTEQQKKKEIINKKNAEKVLNGGINVKIAKPRRSLRRRDTRPARKSTKNRVRSPRRRSF